MLVRLFQLNRNRGEQTNQSESVLRNQIKSAGFQGDFLASVPIQPSKTQKAV